MRIDLVRKLCRKNTRKVLVEVVRGSVSSFWHIRKEVIEENCHGNATACTIF